MGRHTPAHPELAVHFLVLTKPFTVGIENVMLSTAAMQQLTNEMYIAVREKELDG